MIMYHLGPQLGVWIMQVSTFSSVLINRFHCTHLMTIISIMLVCYAQIIASIPNTIILFMHIPLA